MLRKLANIFWSLHKPFLFKNRKMQGTHVGETCLIFGNGGSLKYFDFSCLPKFPAICTTHSLSDSRFRHVNVKYWVLSDPYLLYPVRYLDRYKKFYVNKLLPLFKKYAIENPDIKLITSLTNFYSGMRLPENKIYFHHFERKDKLSYDLAGDFSCCEGALDIMIGIAKYLGFSKVIILGCDYLGSPKLEGHFYGRAAPYIGIDDLAYTSRVREIVGEDLEVLLVFPKGVKSPYFDSVCYEDFFGSDEKYKDRSEFIKPEYLNMMSKAEEVHQIHL